MPFLSLLDDRAKPKGSRDPLGFEMVWSHFGRKVIGNLTTITSSMDNFAVALLGFHWANDLVPSSTKEADRNKLIRQNFLRYEQVTGYIRYYGEATDIMGITRIKKRIHDESFKIKLGQASNEQILSDQASYGLWGLYSAASRDTGLVSGNDRVLTALGHTIITQILKILGEVAEELHALMLSDKPVSRNAVEKMAPVFMKAIQDDAVQDLLLDALMAGNDAEGVQQELWGITKAVFTSSEVRPKNLGEFIQLVNSETPSAVLSQNLKHIQDMEKLLVATNNIFHYLRRKDGSTLADIIDELDKKDYDYSYLMKELPAHDFPHKDILLSLLLAFRRNDMATVIQLTLQLNKSVMHQRSGAPWVEQEAGQKLRVKVKSEKVELKKQKKLETHWDYDYFLGSFINIARQQVVHQ